MQSVLVGFFDFRGPAVSLDYREFYKAAIRALERDPNRDVIFAAVTSANVAAAEFNIEHTPSASLYLWNESLIYPEDKVWTSENLLHWMERSIHKVSLWLQPPGVKSSTLAPYLHDGPVLLLFTPRNPLHPTNYNHDLLREIALEYYSCGDNVLAEQLTKRLRIKRKNSIEQHREKSKRCIEITDDTMIQPPPPLPVSISIQQWINNSCCAQVYINKCLLCERDNSPKNNICNIAPSKIDEFCKRTDIFNVLNTQNSEEHYSCCDNYRLSEPHDPEIQYFSSRMNENDSRSAIAVRLRYIQDECTYFLAGDKYHYPIFPEETKEQYSTVKLDTSACDMNRTMAFLSIDSLNYYHFAEGLGINILQMRDKTAVVILDSLRESQYLMSDKLSLESLVKFINNYNNGSLSRTLRSDAIRQYGRDLKIDSCKNNKLSEVCIQELNTETFFNTILDPTKDVVVMYHSPYCAFCSAVSFVYLTVANLLSKVNHIVFVRIDGDSNDLPWEYTMNRYPSILFFPAKRKEDSTIFSASLPITVPNLLNFILANLESDIHIEALINICNKGSGESPDNCVARIRRYCLEVIQNYLKNYRKLMRHSSNSQQFNSKLLNKRREILLKLEHIRDIHLILSIVEDLKKDVEKYNDLINKFHVYYKNLEMMKNRMMNVHKQETVALKKQKYINDEL
ncbi:hypothetical protein PV327_008457 [Microctonus hyperodae]|uniref:Thioredoxin domain-containing protein n=1 Tax=Microctonus hyperodae TaxID=165561 RepID=A0AA39F370_MICHY|nr:hypothetical protein PV327_008457 [Microctonus hyperodae]